MNKINEDMKGGKLMGYATIKGCLESDSMRRINPAGSRFGFCAQNYAPTSDQVGEYTKQNFKHVANLSDQSVDNFIQSQMPRTLVPGTFYSEETVSTSYLCWLMVQRRFDNFEIPT